MVAKADRPVSLRRCLALLVTVVGFGAGLLWLSLVETPAAQKPTEILLPYDPLH